MGWINVKERLPQEYVMVLIHSDGFVNMGYRNDSEWYELCHEGHELAGDTTHWMPLPEPPQVDQPTQKSCEGCEHHYHSFPNKESHPRYDCNDFSNYQARKE